MSVYITYVLMDKVERYEIGMGTNEELFFVAEDVSSP